MSPIETIMRTAPVIPVLVIEDVAHARPIAQALVAGGLTVLEVTLRTPAALDVIREMSMVKGAIVGAGTVLNEADLRASIDAGAKFIVSPGLTEPLGKAAIASTVPFLPGDRLFLYSDGVTECANPAQEPYRIERLEQAVSQWRGEDLESTVASIEHDLRKWRGDGEFADDVTLFALERRAA